MAMLLRLTLALALASAANATNEEGLKYLEEKGKEKGVVTTSESRLHARLCRACWPWAACSALLASRPLGPGLPLALHCRLRAHVQGPPRGHRRLPPHR